MKIAMIAPRIIPIPPVDYGGTERVIYYLTEELVKRGHDVVLFAAKGSRTNAKLIEYPSGNKKKVLDYVIRHMPSKVDIIHDHEGFVAKVNPPIPTLRQTHGGVFIRRAQVPVYVSETMLNTVGRSKGYFIHNGIELTDYSFSETKDNYLLFMGRLSAMKGVHHAIQVAKRIGRRLIIAGPGRESQAEESYFQAEVKPHLGTNISYIGSVGGEVKRELLSKAYCVLFPSVCNEAFGLVPIEALASGTPVLGLRYGAVPEVLRGFPELLCNDTDEMIYKMKLGSFPSAQECLSYVEQHFTAKQMTDKALQVYKHILKKSLYQIKASSEWNIHKRKLRSR